jgi:hypothetical protein
VRSAALDPQDDPAGASAATSSPSLLVTAGTETILSVLLDLPPQRESRAQQFGRLNSASTLSTSLLTASAHDGPAAAAAATGATASGASSLLLNRGASSSALAGSSPSGPLPQPSDAADWAARVGATTSSNTWTAPVRDQMDLLVASFRWVGASRTHAHTSAASWRMSHEEGPAWPCASI